LKLTENKKYKIKTKDIVKEMSELKEKKDRVRSMDLFRIVESKRDDRLNVLIFFTGVFITLVSFADNIFEGNGVGYIVLGLFITFLLVVILIWRHTRKYAKIQEELYMMIIEK
jgi:hypothetical protein